VPQDSDPLNVEPSAQLVVNLIPSDHLIDGKAHILWSIQDLFRIACHGGNRLSHTGASFNRDACIATDVLHADCGNPMTCQMASLSEVCVPISARSVRNDHDWKWASPVWQMHFQRRFPVASRSIDESWKFELRCFVATVGR
jgi:hypothetical protein